MCAPCPETQLPNRLLIRLSSQLASPEMALTCTSPTKIRTILSQCAQTKSNFQLIRLTTLPSNLFKSVSTRWRYILRKFKISRLKLMSKKMRRDSSEMVTSNLKDSLLSVCSLKCQ